MTTLESRKRIDEFTAAGALAGTELLPIWQTGATRQTTMTAFATFVAPLVAAALPAASEAFTSVASAATVNLGAAATKNVSLTGSTGVTSFGSTAATGARYLVTPAASSIIFTHSANLKVPNAANLTLAAGDYLEAIHKGSGAWEIIRVIRMATGRNFVNGATVGSNKGLAVDAATDPSAPSFSMNVPIVRGGYVTLSGGTATVHSSSGSVTASRTAAGLVTLGWPALPDTNYMVLCTGEGASAGVRVTVNVVVGSKTTTGCVMHFDNGASDADPASFAFAVVRF